MNVSEDGTVTGSIDHAKLAEVEPKTDEARAQLEQLRADAAAGQEQVAADEQRLAEQAAAQDPNVQASQLQDGRDAQGKGPTSSDQDGTQQPAGSVADADSTTEAPAGEEDLDALRAEAEGLGVKVDRRWGADRLRSEVDTARQSQAG